MHGPQSRRALEEFATRVATRFDLPDATHALDSAAADALDAFAAEGVDGLLLKGPALARQLYTAAECRKYADVDLLVAPDDVGRARRVLEALGYKNMSAALGIDDVGGVVHEESWLRTGGSPREHILIELHLRLAGAESPPRVVWDALMAHRSYIELDGRRVPVLEREGLGLLLATHAAQHGLAYRKGLSELALGLERWHLDIWQGAAALAGKIGATDGFAAGLRLVPRGAELARVLRLPATERLDWEIRHRNLRPRGTFHLQALVEERGFAARGHVLRRALLPSRTWIVSQYAWARTGRARLALAYALHLARAPAWAFRAWRFGSRARRAA